MKFSGLKVGMSCLILGLLGLVGISAGSCLAENYNIHDFDGRSHLVEGAHQSKNGKQYVLKLHGGNFARYTIESGIQKIPNDLIGGLKQIKAIANNGDILLLAECTFSILNNRNTTTQVFQVPDCDNRDQVIRGTLNARGSVVISYLDGESYKFIIANKNNTKTLRTVRFPNSAIDDIYLYPRVDISDNGKALTYLYYNDYETSQSHVTAYRHDIRRGTSTKIPGVRKSSNQVVTLNSKNGTAYFQKGNKIFSSRKRKRRRHVSTIRTDKNIIEKSEMRYLELNSNGTAHATAYISKLKHQSRDHLSISYVNIIEMMTNRKGKALLIPCLIKNNERLKVKSIKHQGENDHILAIAFHKDHLTTNFVVLEPRKEKDDHNYCALSHEEGVEINGVDFTYAEASYLVYGYDAKEEDLTSQACSRNVRATNLFGEPLSGKSILLKYEEGDSGTYLQDVNITNNQGKLQFSRSTCESTIKADVYIPFNDDVYQSMDDYLVFTGGGS